MSHIRLLPVADRNTERNFKDLEAAIKDLPDPGLVATRWRFVQSADTSKLNLEYYDGKQWVVKATWP